VPNKSLQQGISEPDNQILFTTKGDFSAVNVQYEVVVNEGDRWRL
jgi:hypothetical protein